VTRPCECDACIRAVSTTPRLMVIASWVLVAIALAAAVYGLVR
jgi:hypothetical protein